MALVPRISGGTAATRDSSRRSGRLAPTRLRGYGQFVGRRFKDLPNIVWLLGGDYALPVSERWAGEQLAAGLRDGGAEQLMTAHGGQTSAVQTYGDRPWDRD